MAREFLTNTDGKVFAVDIERVEHGMKVHEVKFLDDDGRPSSSIEERKSPSGGTFYIATTAKGYKTEHYEKVKS